MAAPLVWTACFGGVQFLGLLSVAWARASKGSVSEKTAQSLFYGFLLLIGAMTAACSCGGNAWWPLSAATFAAMVVGATIDARSSEDAAF